MLYIINQASITLDVYKLIKSTDVVLLIADGVYAACSPDGMLIKSENNFTVYALQSDLIARGLMGKVLPNIQIKIIDYAGFVDLTVQHNPIVNL